MTLSPLFIARHDGFGSFEYFVLAHCHRKFEQELPVDRLDVVEGHSVWTDNSPQHIVNAVHSFLLLQLSEQLLQVVLLVPRPNKAFRSADGDLGEQISIVPDNSRKY